MTNTADQKIYVSTIIDTFNYGTVMQAVATRDVLEAYGHPVFIDYYRPQWTAEGHKDIYLSRSGSPLVNRLHYCITLPQWNHQKKMFRTFLEQELELCEADPFVYGGDFASDAVYCVGSDQTWNYEDNGGLDPVYFLTNVPDQYKKIAFSASFGRESLGYKERLLTKRALACFDAISVRESSSVAILGSMGLSGTALKDPVLLCNPNLWSDLADDAPVSADPYVLVYMLNENPRMIDYARRVAELSGCKIRIVTFSVKQKFNMPKGFKQEFQPAPERWLALFRDASYVVTDSFHGTCFSLLFEHPMTVFDPPKFSVRLTDVLSDFGLQERRVHKGNDSETLGIYERTIDWGYIRGLKAKHACEAHAFLDSCLRGDAEYE